MYFINHLWTIYLKKLFSLYKLLQFPLRFITVWASFEWSSKTVSWTWRTHWRHCQKKEEKATLIEMVPYLLTVLLAFPMFCSKSELPHVSYRKVHIQKYIHISESLNVPNLISNDNHPPNQHRMIKIFFSVSSPDWAALWPIFPRWCSVLWKRPGS